MIPFAEAENLRGYDTLLYKQGRSQLNIKPVLFYNRHTRPWSYQQAAWSIDSLVKMY